MAGPRTSEAAVSSVIGTVLMLGITVSVFAGVSIVVLSQFEETDQVPRSDLGVLRGEGAYLLQHNGGDPIRLDGASLLVGVGAVGREVPLTDFAASTADGETWRLGETLCVSCRFPDQDVTGVQFVTASALLLNEGTVPSARLVNGVNLVVDDPEADPDGLRAGQETLLRARITNVGRQATGADVSMEVLVDGASVGTATGTALESGTALRLEVPWTATTGTHTVQFVADPAGAVAESDEADNTATMVLEVVASVADPGFAYEDVNLDGRFGEVHGDIPIERSALEGGAYTTDPAHGLVIPRSWGPLSAPSVSLTAARIEVHVGLTGQSGGVLVDSAGDVVLTGDVATLTDGGAVTVDADGLLTAPDVTIQARGAVTLDGTDVDLTDAILNLRVASHALSLTTTGDLLLDAAVVEARGAVAATVGGALSSGGLSLDMLTAGAALDVTAGSINLADATVHILGGVTLDTTGDMDVSRLVLRIQGAGYPLNVLPDGALTATDADLELADVATVQGSTVSAAGLRLVSPGDNNDNLNVLSTTGSLDVSGSVLTTNGHLYVTGTTGVDASGATLTTTSTQKKDVGVKSDPTGHVNVEGATLVATRDILLTVTDTGTVPNGYLVFVQGATFLDEDNAATVSPESATSDGAAP